VQVRFWGTRGSVPTSITAQDVQDKLIAALLAANGRKFADANEAKAFTESELSFAQRGTYGGSSYCVEMDAGDAFKAVLADGTAQFFRRARGLAEGWCRKAA